MKLTHNDPKKTNNDLFDAASDIARIEKSKLELKKTVQPGVTVSGYQKKAFNALMFFVQSYAAKYFHSMEAFHNEYNESILQLKIPKSQFLTLTDYDSRNTTFIKRALQELSKLQVIYDNGLDGDLAEFRFQNMLHSAGVEGPNVVFEVMPDTRRAIVSKQIEATIDVIKVNKNLNGKYALSLYELLHSAYERMSNHTETITISDEDLRRGLFVPYKLKGQKKIFSYPSIGVLNARVLNSAIDEINSCDFEFKIEHSFKRLGCGDVEWSFKLTKTEFENFAIIANENASEITTILESLKNYGVKQTQEWLMKCHNEKELMYMLYCIEEVNKALKSRGSTIKNRGGYFVRTYENNREPFEVHYAHLQAAREKKYLEMKAQEKRNLKHQRETKIRDQMNAMRKAAWDALSEAERQELQNEFISVIVANEAPHSLKNIDEKGFEIALSESGILRGHWTGYLNEKMNITQERVDKSLENMRLTGIYR